MERLILLALNIFLIICIPIAVLAILVFVEMNLDLITKIIIGFVVLIFFIGLAPKKWSLTILDGIKNIHKVFVIISFIFLIFYLFASRPSTCPECDEYLDYRKEQSN